MYSSIAFWISLPALSFKNFPSAFLILNSAFSSLAPVSSSAFTNFLPPITTFGSVGSSGFGFSLSLVFLIITFPLSSVVTYSGSYPDTRSTTLYVFALSSPVKVCLNASAIVAV